MTNIVLYGDPQQHWAKALHPNSKFWNKLEIKSKVVISKNEEKIRVIKDKIIIPLSEEDIKSCPFECLKPSIDIIELFHNKRNFKDFLKANNINNYAQDYTIENVEFPVILKRTDLVKGRGVILIKNIDQLKQTLSSTIFLNQEYILEKYIPTDFEPVTWMVCKDGEVFWHKSLQWSKHTSPTIKKGAEPGGIEYNPSESTIDLFKQVVKISNYTGPIAFNYKMFEDEAVIFEVNPRIGGSLMLEENWDILAGSINTIVKISRDIKK
jgi:carbamoylphosphate synthase large subunit